MSAVDQTSKKSGFVASGAQLMLNDPVLALKKGERMAKDAGG